MCILLGKTIEIPEETAKNHFWQGKMKDFAVFGTQPPSRGHMILLHKKYPIFSAYYYINVPWLTGELPCKIHDLARPPPAPSLHQRPRDLCAIPYQRLQVEFPWIFADIVHDRNSKTISGIHNRNERSSQNKFFIKAQRPIRISRHILKTAHPFESETKWGKPFSFSAIQTQSCRRKFEILWNPMGLVPIHINWWVFWFLIANKTGPNTVIHSSIISKIWAAFITSWRSLWSVQKWSGIVVTFTLFHYISPEQERFGGCTLDHLSQVKSYTESSKKRGGV